MLSNDLEQCAYREASAVLASHDWAVVTRKPPRLFLRVHIHIPSDTAKHQKPVVTVKHPELRMFATVGVVQPDGAVDHAGSWARHGMNRQCLAWRSLKRLWPELRRGVIPEGIIIIPDSAFDMRRRKRFGEAHPAILARLERPPLPAYGPKARHYLALVDRFGELTAHELENVRKWRTRLG